MKIFLSIDGGNTNPHIGYFQEGELKSIIPFKKNITLPKLIQDHEPTLKLKLNHFYYSISNVSNLEISSFLKKGSNVNLKKNFKNGFFFNMPIHYEKTLGEDRLFQSFYLYSIYSSFLTNTKKSSPAIILIDAGTFTTIDLITHQGFLGGFILPGVKQYNSINTHGANLPVIDHFNNPNYQITSNHLPQTTHDALVSGIDLLYANAISNILNRTSHLIKIILTGSKLNLIENIFKKYFSKYVFEKDIFLIHNSIHFCALQELNKAITKDKLK